MAIQTINLAVPGGDTPRSANTKINANFSDQTNAASKLIGGKPEDISKNNRVWRSSCEYRAEDYKDSPPLLDLNNMDFGTVYLGAGVYGVLENAPLEGTTYPYVLTTRANTSTRKSQIAELFNRDKSRMFYRSQSSSGAWYGWAEFFTTVNTKLDTNGAISPSSPTIDLYSYRIETNTDAARMNPEFVRNGVGDYTIKNTTGLRDEGWYIKIPNDMNGNPKVAVAIDTDKNGDLSIKTYKRTFSMETFIFGPDLNEPLDIPEGRWIDLRFNDLPQEQLDEPIE